MSPRLAILLSLLLSCCSLLQAQHLLYVRQKDKLYPVCRVQHCTPQYMDGDTAKWAKSEGMGDEFTYGMQTVDLYSPKYVRIRSVKVQTEGISIGGSAHQINKLFTFAASFSADYPLKNVFLALELQTGTTDSGLVVLEVGDLKPGVWTPVDLRRTFMDDFVNPTYILHLFVGGEEALHSEMPAELIDAALDAVVADRIKGATSANPKPLVGPQPRYPDALKSSRESGSATISLLIRANGAASELVMKEASRPEFGQAALDALRTWRFLPKVKDGQPVEARITLPFKFVAPAE